MRRYGKHLADDVASDVINHVICRAANRSFAYVKAASDILERNVEAGHRRALGMACRAVRVLLMAAPSAPLLAQFPGEPYWSAYGDVGGLFGGRWLDGSSSPSVTSRTGASAVSHTHLRVHETVLNLVCRPPLENKNQSHLLYFHPTNQIA